ncbi:hypothetical protein Y032_0067g41 [Ancylostoma ceylanicum]|uniref:Uncharacterized protein n=1 Tax=Ancylostoma ceylanicum TaxID=53326 RepID=A0A016TZE7_9BILA|nr:hypothetical protein Y032_0067g41 [Ancylostoma ceylanicum]
MAVAHLRPRQGRRATVPRAPESMSSTPVMLFLARNMKKKRGKITKLERRAPRNSTRAADDNDSGSRGAVA